MKISLLATCLLILSINAQALIISPEIQMEDQGAYAIVDNKWDAPMLCKGTLQAVDANGSEVDEWMNNVMIYPGQKAYMFVRAYGDGNYIRDVVAEAKCRF